MSQGGSAESSGSEVGEGFKYWAFISYSHRDNQKGSSRWGDWLHDAVENFSVPAELVGKAGRYGEPVPQRLYPAFQDEKELPTDANLGTAIQEALRRSRYLVVICSPRSANSIYVNQEVLEFKRLGRGNRILAIIIDGEPNASEPGKGIDPALECFPPALRHPLAADGNLDLGSRTEPIAADMRDVGSRSISLKSKADRPLLEREKLRVMSGLLGVGFDDLVQRDRERELAQARARARRLRRLVTGFAVLALLALVAGGLAMVERQRAETQRQQAVAEKVEADREKQQVEEKTAADEEELGRSALQAGDSLTAAEHLKLAYEIYPHDPSVRLMLHAALSGMQGLVSVLGNTTPDRRAGKVITHAGKVLRVNAEGTAGIWDAKTGTLLAVLGTGGYGSYSKVTADLASDGSRALFASDSEFVVHDLATGKKVALPLEADAELSDARFSEDGKRVVAVEDSHGKTLLAWFESDTGKEHLSGSFSGRYGCVGTARSGGQAILLGFSGTYGTADFLRNAVVVDLSNGKTVAKVPVKENDRVLPSPDGEFMLVCPAFTPGIATVYSTQTGAKAAELGDKASRYIYNPLLWTGSADRVLLGTTLWDVSTSKQVLSWPREAWNAAAVDPTGALLATHNSLGIVSVWDSRSGKRVKQYKNRIGWTVTDANLGTSGESLQFSEDGRYLIASSGDGVTTWDWRQADDEETELTGHAKPVNCITFSADGGQAVTGSDDGSVIVWNSKSGVIEQKLADASNGAGAMFAEFIPQAQQVATAGIFEKAALWDSVTGKKIRDLDFNKHGVVIGDHTLLGVSSRGDRLVTMSDSGWGALWDPHVSTPLASVQGSEGGRAGHLSFSPDGAWFIVADDKGFARVFESAGGKLRRRLGAGGRPLLTAALSRAGDSALLVDDKGAMTVLSVVDGRVLAKINAGAGAPPVNDVMFSPDGARVIAGCRDSTVRVWDAATGKPLLRAIDELLPGEVAGLGPPISIVAGAAVRSGMQCVRCSPDGSFFAGATQTGNVCLWDAASGKEIRRFNITGGQVLSLAFSADGSRLGGAIDDGTARIWDVGLESRTPGEIDKLLPRKQDSDVSGAGG